jgi:ubiquitin-conjugating enzyme E2 J2
MEINPIARKRITGDFKLFAKENPTYFDILPNESNMLEIYFLMYGRESTPYEGGLYIGKIVHNPDYPRKAPDYYMFTPNGRFELSKKICLTNSSFHNNDWAPAAWNLVTILEGFSSVFHSEIKEDKIGISHIKDAPVETIKKYAQDSINYNTTYMAAQFHEFPKVKNNFSPYMNKDIEV